MMQFEWDEKKRLRNIKKHGIDFFRAVEIFYSEYVVIRSDKNEEVRYKAIGELEGKIWTVIYTLRGDSIRLVSARRAWENEQRAYSELYERGN